MTENNVRQVMEAIAKQPVALQPMYITTVPNEPVTLYSGPFEADLAGETVRENGDLRLVWLPSPRLVIECNTENEKWAISSLLDEQCPIVKLPDSGPVDSLIESVTVGETDGSNLRLLLNGPMLLRRGQACRFGIAPCPGGVDGGVDYVGAIQLMRGGEDVAVG